MELYLINAALPLKAEGKLYTLKAADGVWTSVEEQQGYNSAEQAIRLTDATLRLEGGSRIIDLEGRLLLPGLADAHMHLDKAKTISAVGNKSGTLLEAIRNYSKAAPSFSKAEIKERIVSTALDGLSRGTLYMRTHLDFQIGHGLDVAMRTMEAALEAREQLKGKVHVQLFPMFPRGRGEGSALEATRELMRLGMDGIGGAPHLGETPDAEIAEIFKLAERFGKPIDLHTDESDDPARRTIAAIARRTMEYGFGGKVTAGHLCSLSSMPQAEAAELIALMAQAGVAAVTLPAANLYLQGREDTGPFRRGVTRVKELLAAGVPIAAASDNIQDPFHPFGRGDLVQIALLTAYAAHMGNPGDLRSLLRMITEVPASIMGLTGYGTAPGNPATFVVMDARTPEELFVQESPSRWVAAGGRWLHVSKLTRWTAPEAFIPTVGIPINKDW